MDDNMDVDTAIGFGKYYDKSISDVPSGYLRWVIENVDGKEDIKKVIQEEIEFRDRFDKHFEA